MRQGKEVLRTLASHLQLELGEENLTKVHAMLRDLKRSHSGNAVCQVTKLWPDHRSLEAQRLQDQAACTSDELNGLRDSGYARVLNSRFKEYQEKYGYI
ncbi:hypothetical protein AK812_SmicGene35842 [Symbiodinium microadriaticum]|uniref:Uncharacterized protein n=1 Tax=Symbiodinium microadriaticum TaxID=2951 RepID=A0A1Q9CKE0_SYMMI|nr:hypothetical protein AK812_SmicGene35842 [Symbiodinium microadriaticum]